MELTESTEQDWYLVRVDAHSSIDDLYLQHACSSIVVRNYLNAAILGELQGILYQVVQHLFESSTVSIE